MTNNTTTNDSEQATSVTEQTQEQESSVLQETSAQEQESNIAEVEGDNEKETLLQETDAQEVESNLSMSSGDESGSTPRKTIACEDLNVDNDASIGGTLTVQHIKTEIAEAPEKNGEGFFSSGAAYEYIPDHIGVDDSDQEGSGTIKLDLRNRDNKVLGVIAKIFVGLSDSDKSNLSKESTEAIAKLKSWIEDQLANYLSKVNEDIAQKKITFKDGVQFGETFVSGLVGRGGKIDGEGRGELRSLKLWDSLEVPEIRYNRISVYTGIRWDTFGGGIIESVTPDPSGAETGTCTLRLEDGEYGAIGVGDLCMGIWHDTTGNATEAKDDNKGNFLFRGFKTVYFQITGVGGTNNNTFTYVLRSSADGGNGIHPFAYMHFAGRGNINNKARQSFTYTTTQYSLSLTGVQTWEFQPENYYFLSGHLDGFSMPAVDSNGKKYTKTFKGYGVVVGNAYIFGQIDQFERAAYRMMIDQSLNGSMQPGETETVTCTIYDGYNKDVTSEFTVWTVKRNSGDSASDAVWNASHTNVGNPFKLAFTDLGLDGISKFVATFTVTATDEKTDAQAKQLIDFYS